MAQNGHHDHGEICPLSGAKRTFRESLPYEQPKLSAISVGYLNATDFASRLDRAIGRSDRAKLIEHSADEGRALRSAHEEFWLRKQRFLACDKPMILCLNQ